MNKRKTISFSGHRTLPEGESLEILKENLRTAIKTAIQRGCDTFLFGGCYGFDLLAASEVLTLREEIPDTSSHLTLLPKKIALYAILPYEGQANHWTEGQRDQYFHFMEQSDDVITLQTHHSPDCYKKRNQYYPSHWWV